MLIFDEHQGKLLRAGKGPSHALEEPNTSGQTGTGGQCIAMLLVLGVSMGNTPSIHLMRWQTSCPSLTTHGLSA